MSPPSTRCGRRLVQTRLLTDKRGTLLGPPVIVNDPAGDRQRPKMPRWAKAVKDAGARLD